MKEIIKKFNKMLFNNLTFKSNGIGLKIITILIYALFIISFFMFSSLSLIIGVAAIIVQALLLYLFYLVLYLVIEFPQKIFFKEMDELCNRIELIFKDEFYNYSSFVTDTKIPEINEFIAKDKLPEKSMLSYWKYWLSTRLESSQVAIPMVALMLLAFFRFPLFIDAFAEVNKNIIDTLINNENMTFLKATFEMFTYPYLFLVYYSNIERVNCCITKIEFLEEIIQ